MKDFIDIIQKRLDIERKSGSPLHDPNPLGIKLLPQLEQAFAALEILVKAKSRYKNGSLFYFTIEGRREIHVPLSTGIMKLGYDSRNLKPYTMTGKAFTTNYKTSDYLLAPLARILGNELETLGEIDTLVYSPKTRDVLDI
jgi:hypothetical protein